MRSYFLAICITKSFSGGYGASILNIYIDYNMLQAVLLVVHRGYLILYVYQMYTGVILEVGNKEFDPGNDPTAPCCF